MKPASFRFQLRTLLTMAGVLIFIEIANLLVGHRLNTLGIYPRELSALPGILLAPLLHASIGHLASNLLPLLLFSWLTMQWSKLTYIRVTLTIWIFSGAAVWLFGRNAIHVGASGLVYGYFGFLLLGGFYARKLPLIAISIGIAILYGGMIFGVLPTRQFVSFEYHLFGLIGGLLAARAWAK